MAKFKKGDRVRVVDVWEEDIEEGIQKGDTGLVLEDRALPFVRMDKYSPILGSAWGLCEDGHGWCAAADQLELVKEPNTTS